MRHRSKRQRWVIQKPKAENRNSRKWKSPRIETSNFRNFGCQFRFRKDQPKMETFRLNFPTSSRKPCLSMNLHSSRNPSSTRNPSLIRNPSSIRTPSLIRNPSWTRNPQIFNFVKTFCSKHVLFTPSSLLLQKAPMCIILYNMPLKPENT